MINSSLDVRHWHQELLRRGRVQIPDFLQFEAAGYLAQLLRDVVPWTLAYRRDGVSRVMPHAELAALAPEDERALLAELARDATGRYGFAYDSYMMVTAYKEGRDPGLPLHRVLEFFNSPEYLEFTRVLGNDPRLRRVNAQATRYRPGQFLKFHDDREDGEGRVFAYVINLTERWEADWGGLLQFLDPEGRVVESFMPRYNTLSLFKVPAPHLVSLVAPWAQAPRLAITGWWQT
jgi:SM-20-related protein